MAFGKVFERVAPILMGDLINEFGLTPIQAAGFVGNFGHESGLVSGQQEGWRIGRTAPIRGLLGGVDFPQWTADRRIAFAKFVEERGLPYPSYQASWEFVKHELRTTHKHALEQVRKTTTIEAAVVTAEAHYEKAGVKHMQSRLAHAERALALYRASLPPIEPIEEVTVATLQRDLAVLSKAVADLSRQVAKLAEEHA